MLIVKDSYRQMQWQPRAKCMGNYTSELRLGEYAINWSKKHATEIVNEEMSRMCQCKLIYFPAFCGDLCYLSINLYCHGRFGGYFRNVTHFKDWYIEHFLRNCSYVNARVSYLWSTLVQLMALCHQEISHYLPLLIQTPLLIQIISTQII